VVGFGPGGEADRTRRAEEAILCSDIVVGYRPYLDRIADLLEGKDRVVSGMKEERTRVEEALRLSDEGHTVALVSSGDAGIYGMAGLALQMANDDTPLGKNTKINVVAGVTAACAAAARMGSPLMLDYVTISLSDLLVPWDTIRKRVEAALAADFVIALYNPRSHTRTDPFDQTLQMAREMRDPETPVGIATAMAQDDETIKITTLGELQPEDVTMKSIVILGNSTSRIENGRFITPRGY